MPSGALDAKLALAAASARTYPHESLDIRIFWMRRLALLLEDDRDELAALTADDGRALAQLEFARFACAEIDAAAPDNTGAEAGAGDNPEPEAPNSRRRFLPSSVGSGSLPRNAAQ